MDINEIGVARNEITVNPWFAVVDKHYSQLEPLFWTRKSAVRSSRNIPSAVRVIQSGYDANGEGYFREVYPRIMRTWQPKFRPNLAAAGSR